MNHFPEPIRRIGAGQVLEKLQARGIPVVSVATDHVTGIISVRLAEGATLEHRRLAAEICEQADTREYRPLSEAEREEQLTKLTEADIAKILRHLALEQLRRNSSLAGKLDLSIKLEVPIETETT